MLKKFGLALGACILCFFFLEGLCSALFVTREMLAPAHRTLSGPSVQYDAELGWAPVPDFHEKSYYAPGIPLRTNSRGFRAIEEFPREIPTGKIRVICSGDSQTFGDGVGDDHTWCQDLAALNPRIQPVNMAETGYGADQMYLRYMRDGAVLDHDVHVFAVVTDDFVRMPYTVLGGYGKPVLKLENGELVAENVPVPRRSAFLHWLALKPHPLREFRSLADLAWLAGRVLPARDAAFANGPSEQQAQVLDVMFENLQATEKQKNSVLVLLYLPERVADYQTGGISPVWRNWVRQECVKQGIVFVDLIDDFRKLPITWKDGLFIWPGSGQYFTEAVGHYNDQGQQWVAEELYNKMIAVPEAAQKVGVGTAAQAAR